MHADRRRHRRELLRIRRDGDLGVSQGEWGRDTEQGMRGIVCRERRLPPRRGCADRGSRALKEAGGDDDTGNGKGRALRVRSESAPVAIATGHQAATADDQARATSNGTCPWEE